MHSILFVEKYPQVFVLQNVGIARDAVSTPPKQKVDSVIEDAALKCYKNCEWSIRDLPIALRHRRMVKLNNKSDLKKNYEFQIISVVV